MKARNMRDRTVNSSDWNLRKLPLLRTVCRFFATVLSEEPQKQGSPSSRLSLLSYCVIALSLWSIRGKYGMTHSATLDVDILHEYLHRDKITIAAIAAIASPRLHSGVHITVVLAVVKASSQSNENCHQSSTPWLQKPWTDFDETWNISA